MNGCSPVNLAIPCEEATAGGGGGRSGLFGDGQHNTYICEAAAPGEGKDTHTLILLKVNA